MIPYLYYVFYTESTSPTSHPNESFQVQFDLKCHYNFTKLHPKEVPSMRQRKSANWLYYRINGEDISGYSVNIRKVEATKSNIEINNSYFILLHIG